MQTNYPIFNYTDHDAENELARFVRIDNPESYPFDQHHAHEYNEVMVFVKGGGRHIIDFKEHTIENASIHLLAKGSLHWLERNANSMGFAIVYKEQYLWKMQMMNADVDYNAIFSTSAVINLNTEQQNDFQFIFQEMLHHQHNAAYRLNLIAVFLTKIALQALHQPPPSIPKPSVLIYKLVEVIEEHYLQNLSNDAYAKMLHTNTSSLMHQVKRNTGKTLFKLVQERKLLEAKKLIVQTNDSLAQIAYHLNFREPAHFTNWFKKLSGQTPQQFRN